MENKELTNINDVAYQKLIDNITALWSESKAKAITAVNTELLEANWQTGKLESISLNLNRVVNKELNMAKGYL